MPIYVGTWYTDERALVKEISDECILESLADLPDKRRLVVQSLPDHLYFPGERVDQTEFFKSFHRLSHKDLVSSVETSHGQLYHYLPENAVVVNALISVTDIVPDLQILPKGSYLQISSKKPEKVFATAQKLKLPTITQRHPLEKLAQNPDLVSKKT